MLTLQHCYYNCCKSQAGEVRDRMYSVNQNLAILDDKHILMERDRNGNAGNFPMCVNVSSSLIVQLDPPCRQGREATIPTELNFDNSKQYNFFDRSHVSQRHISPKIHRSTTKSLFYQTFSKNPKSVFKTGSRRRPL